MLLLTEDLGASGHALVGAEISEAQLDGAIDALVALHAWLWDAIPRAISSPRGRCRRSPSRPRRRRSR